ncbi:helix-turn-helix transcriptional regulator [Niabella yanshanensis]|uniref:Helix-turn-helix transcriptional regulator n=1 Tax=Niabella yanshanensis TaxID=577386 RepID=A0ABZ0WBV0_9BACT|nr:helix-turn-helix domain-containing protein [Niabella yanshanensis]WQD39611.1 helix-turn-helix transcriptional regulator [Niabella yanshanensis]
MAKDKASKINEYHLNRYQPDRPQLALHDLNHYINQHSGDTTRPHIHSYYQVIWFTRGKGKHFIDFKSYDVANNTIFFIAKNQVHYFDSNTHYEGILIHFNESFLVQQENETDFCLKCNLFNNPYDQPAYCSGDGMDGLLNVYIKQMKEELAATAGFGKEELLRIYLKAFLIQLQRRRQAEGDKQVQVLDEKRLQLVKFVNLVDEHYSKGYSVSEYASILLVSTRTLSDLTQHALGKTPSQLIQERIVLEAQRLLLHSGLNINQIGYRLGFDDPSYFVKYFKKHTNISPTEFRKAIS